MTGPAPFALVPRRRFVGTPFGHRRSARRGTGDEIAGTRPYRPGDLRASIHWPASARLSSARGTDEFVVREHYADEAPWVAVVLDRRPGMSVRPAPSPWLDKAAAADAAVKAIAASAAAVNAPLVLEDRPSLRLGLAALIRRAAELPTGSFVFAVSDFLEPVPASEWLHLRALRWDVVPVVVQDPVWEQSFPEVGGVSLPVADATAENAGDLWLTTREARARATANEQRFADTLARFRRLGFDPVVAETNDVRALGAAFGAWSERRLRLLRSGRL